MGDVSIAELAALGDVLLQGMHVEALTMGAMDAASAAGFVDMFVNAAQLQPTTDAAYQQLAKLPSGITIARVQQSIERCLLRKHPVDNRFV